MGDWIAKRKRKDYILDKLHKGFVNVCIAVTLVGAGFVGYKAYEYIRYIRPQYKAQESMNKAQLLSEGRYIEDSAKDIK